MTQANMDQDQDRTDYSNFTKEELIEKIRKLDCHVKQLRNVISKQERDSSSNPRKRQKPNEDGDGNGDDDSDADEILQLQLQPVSSKKKKQRDFDFAKASTRHVALKFLYLGWDYQGFSVQEDTNETIEAHLFKALTLTRLIEHRSKSNYHRCGRTDKGVSAFSQIVSIDLRSRVVDGKETLDYCKMLNNTLPKEIRVIAWSPVRPDFSARFDCCRRIYKYFFPRGNLNIKAMVSAAQFLIGEHDFRNFCKVDKDARTTMRKVLSADIEIVNSKDDPFDMCHFVIIGSSFLWHQIRCIVGILLLIGNGGEEPEIIQELLDINKNPNKPQYAMAIDYPLCLYDAGYQEVENIQWTYTSENMTALLGDLQSSWVNNAILTDMTKTMLTDIDKCTDVKPSSALTSPLLPGEARRIYVKLMDRPVCGSKKEK